MVIIKDFPNKPLLDRKDFDFIIANSNKNLEDLFIEAPVVTHNYENDTDVVVGVVLYAHHKFDKSLFYGTIRLFNDSYTDVQVTDHYFNMDAVDDTAYQIKSITLVVKLIE